jgi:hypothetical protein
MMQHCKGDIQNIRTQAFGVREHFRADILDVPFTQTGVLGAPATAFGPEIAPVEKASAPVKNLAEPVETASAPVQQVISPVEAVLSPVEEVISPVEAVLSPVDKVFSPVQKASAPVPATKKPLGKCVPPRFHRRKWVFSVRRPLRLITRD